LEKAQARKRRSNAAIKKAEYKASDIYEIVEAQKHLLLGEKNNFKSMLQNYLPLFQGKQGYVNRRQYTETNNIHRL
jgi:hypothetical protein